MKVIPVEEKIRRCRHTPPFGVYLYIRVQRFQQLGYANLLMVANKILRYIHKKRFSVFRAVSCAFAFKVYKKC
jgi:hypothetical protein